MESWCSASKRCTYIHVLPPARDVIKNLARGDSQRGWQLERELAFLQPLTERNGVFRRAAGWHARGLTSETQKVTERQKSYLHLVVVVVPFHHWAIVDIIPVVTIGNVSYPETL
jgi:hypothetical protein